MLKFNILIITLACIFFAFMTWFLDCDRVCVTPETSPLAALLIKCNK